MVKADPKYDYYADLEIESNADENEVKKKFRLLGMPKRCVSPKMFPDV